MTNAAKKVSNSSPTFLSAFAPLIDGQVCEGVWEGEGTLKYLKLTNEQRHIKKFILGEEGISIKFCKNLSIHSFLKGKKFHKKIFLGRSKPSIIVIFT